MRRRRKQTPRCGVPYGATWARVMSVSAAVKGVVMKIAAPSKLQWVTGVYGLLYVAFEVLALIPSTRSLIIENSRPESMGLEVALTQLLCPLFLYWAMPLHGQVSSLQAGFFSSGSLSFAGWRHFRFVSEPAAGWGPYWACRG